MVDKILVIDDNRDSAQTLVWAMEALGHSARMAVGGVNALETVETYKPDVVLCDLNMPDINGFDVCVAMRKDPKLKHTLFIAQSGWSSPMHRQASAMHGFHYHLTKPIDFGKLEKLIEQKDGHVA